MSTRPTCVLTLLCVVQGCERFAFSAMLPLFVLYLHHRHGLSEPTALLVLGLFNALSYVSGLPGGMLADRALGATRSLIAGAAMLTAGYGALAIDRAVLLWPGFILMVIGHGLFRPAMATWLGSLVPATDPRRERAFLWQYLAANLAFVAGPLGAGYAVSEPRWGWRGLFLLAMSPMAVGTLLLVPAAALLRSLPPQRRTDTGSPALSPTDDTDSAMRWRAVWLLSALAVVFWLTALQAGGALALFAESYTVRSVGVLGHAIAIGPTQFASLHGLVVLALLPLFMMGTGALRRGSMEPSAPVKMVWGYVATAAAFALLAAACLHGGDTARVGAGWLLGCYILLSVAELLLGPFGLSLVTQIAPPDHTGQAVGLWFAAAAVGNIAAGGLGLLWGHWPNHRYFALLALASLGAAVVLLTRLSLLERLINASRTKPEGGRR